MFHHSHHTTCKNPWNFCNWTNSHPCFWEGTSKPNRVTLQHFQISCTRGHPVCLEQSSFLHVSNFQMQNPLWLQNLLNSPYLSTHTHEVLHIHPSKWFPSLWFQKWRICASCNCNLLWCSSSFGHNTLLYCYTGFCCQDLFSKNCIQF